MTRGAAALAILSLAGAALAACGNVERATLPLFPPAPDAPLEYDALAVDPGVYAGRTVLLVGDLSVANGQACLRDRNRQIAVRLTADQAVAWRDVQNWPVAVRGVFSQKLCPDGYACPEFCTPYGVDAGASLTDAVPEQE